MGSFVATSFPVNKIDRDRCFVCASNIRNAYASRHRETTELYLRAFLSNGLLSKLFFFWIEMCDKKNVCFRVRHFDSIQQAKRIFALIVCIFLCDTTFV